ncbi:hypothetical protein KSX_94610 [Ktedonospora formicarum]|uniref:Uncharacterized protein n=1 Tax=Ktedonospora formicarum TaxID=2778364 RepID=A0A8J3MYY5_9CHLR|nr:hypothetical protein KSX_94610 [Ktedonospora formicarum]
MKALYHAIQLFVWFRQLDNTLLASIGSIAKGGFLVALLGFNERQYGQLMVAPLRYS